LRCSTPSDIVATTATEGSMNEVAILTDSVAAVPAEIARKCGIGVLPLHVIMDGKSYPDTFFL